MTQSKQPEQYLCRCNGLDDAADDPDSPVMFDEMMNEYYIESRDGRGHHIIYHCPFCGGHTPASRRGSFFAKPPMAEFQRLKELTRDVHTIEDALRILGTPGWDNPHGLTVSKPATHGNPPLTTVHRVLRYYDLSETLDVDVTGFGSGARVSFQPKELAPDALAPADPPMRARNLSAKQDETKKTLFCTMCGKTNHEATRMITGLKANICDECVSTCVQILNS